MPTSRILIQLDSDPHPSVFDAVVAVDSGVDQLFQYGGVEPTQVRDLVYGAMFTRAPDQLHHTAIFVGGSDVSRGEQLLEQVTRTFFGPMRVSVMLDANGANTTAAAAVVAARSHCQLDQISALVLAGTGAVGRRVGQLLAAAGSRVTVASRSAERAAEVAAVIGSRVPQAQIQGAEVVTRNDLEQLLPDVQLVVSAGAPGVELLPVDLWQRHTDSPRVLIDLNAVPPLGIGGVQVTDRATMHGQTVTYGAIGVGGLKMKIHRAALQTLFDSNKHVLDAAEIYAIGCQLKGHG
ncbi:MAG: NAD(P)-dependent methylenetetrahydromethanopterin dehydrogenase [Pirellulales bacterium]